MEHENLNATDMASGFSAPAQPVTEPTPITQEYVPNSASTIAPQIDVPTISPVAAEQPFYASAAPKHSTSPINTPPAQPYYAQATPIAPFGEAQKTPKKKSKKLWIIVSIAVIVAIALTVGICYFTTKVDSIKIDDEIPMLAVNEMFELDVRIEPSGREVEWTSSDESVATVKNGKIRARGVGTCTISAEKYGVKESVRIEVLEKVTDIQISDFISIQPVEETIALHWLITPSDTPLRALQFHVSNPEIAEIVDGKLVTKSAGKCEIEAVAFNGYSQTFSFDVREYISELKLSTSSIELEEKEAYSLGLQTVPEVYFDEISWSSDNESVATVSANGTITAVREGTCLITATSGKGITKSCAVTVVEPMSKEDKILVGTWKLDRYCYYYPNNTYYKISDDYYSYGDTVVFNADHTWDMTLLDTALDGTWSFYEKSDSGEYIYITSNFISLFAYYPDDKELLCMVELEDDEYICFYFKKDKSY